ncbi:hypothetical protein BKA62DRAFT_433923 [Auriculariales sp. MPI-PUGE-AT-0066]|nr:hypothetical protein BKA62DRAFT_433923 [Auriculariales sp. MPI-PUGE-AT-0066]
MFAEKPGLPWGISAIMQFVRMLDPTLADDLSSEKPWIMSPLLSAMPFLKVEKIEANSRWPEFPAAQPFVDNCHILQAPTSNIERRKYFRDPAKRSEHTFGPELLLTADFVHGHVHFPSLKISFPGGIELQSTKYWHEGQRVMLAGCEKAADGSAGPGRTFFCVAFEIVPE